MTFSKRWMPLVLSAIGSILLIVSAALGEPAEAACWGEGLTDRELAISRWFSHLTFMQNRDCKPWPEWHDDGKQLGITSLRYQLAFAGYGCAAMAAKTPAYRELVEKQLRDLCQRMIDLRVWYYVTRYWKYDDGPPDPCLRENVMYTGHLAQLMCLYELMTGDPRYSESGWDFVWRDGRKTHYDLRQSIERLHVQAEKSAQGGICCEPGLLFATCNSHSAASFLLFDVLHGTRYAEVNAKWFGWLSQNCRIKIPSPTNFFYVAYDQGKGLFLPLGDVGADCWTLGWSYPWFPAPDLAREGWTLLLDKTQWHSPQPDLLYAQNSLVLDCCGGTPLSVSNAFVPLLAVQVEGKDSPTARKVLCWLESRFGRAVDMDGDGCRESYYYHTDDALRVAATGNIAAALATDGDSLRRLFRTSRRQFLAEPTVAHVDYPNVCVRSAEYKSPGLRFTVLSGRPGFHATTEIVCEQIPGPAALVRDGRPFPDFKQTGSTVVIQTDVAREHVFELTVPVVPVRTSSPQPASG